jgi:DNA (cytosine-5)-methyltransferase 1
MKFIELFAGIGGFRLGLEQAGHECVYANEWLEKPASIYEKNFGDKPDRRDIRTITGDSLPDADLIVGGFPCATFSIAGKRTGFHLDDTRGTLCFEMFRLARDKRIPYILFENVKGLLNHERGRTFQVILSALDEMGYDAQWELLDSQNFGVPQHRERIFLVANLRGKPRLEVFPLTIPDGTDVGNGHQTQEQGERVREQDSEGATIGTLCHRLYGGNTNNVYLEEHSVAQWRRGHFRDYKSDGTPTLTANMGLGGHNVPFGRTAQQDSTVLATDDFSNESLKEIGDEQKLKLKDATKQGWAEAKVGDAVNLGYPDSETRRGRDSTTASHTLMANGVNGVVVPVLTPNRVEKRQNGRRFKDDGENAFALTAQDRHGVYDGIGIRKLTPLECERLQGLPDHWTKWYADGKLVSDAERYERCGRTVSIPVIYAIGKKLR